MQVEEFLEHLSLEVDPFAVCVVSTGWRLKLSELELATLHFVLRGHGQLRVPKAPPVALAPYHLVVVPAGRMHALQVPSDQVREVDARNGPGDRHRVAEHVAGLDGDRELVVACGQLQARYGDAVPVFAMLDRPLVVDLSATPAVGALFEQILRESTGDALGRASMLRALMEQCFVHLLRQICDDPDCGLPWLRAVEDARLAPALAAVLTSPADPHTVASLAEISHVSRSTFARDFAEVFGQPPMAFVREIRLRRGAELLDTTDWDVATIAHRIGFSSRSHFSRAFKDHFGVRPADRRRSPPAT